MEYSKFTVQSFVDYMLREHGVTVDIKQVGYESVELTHDELDLELTPEHILRELPNPTLYNTYIYSNEKEWMVAVAVEAITYRPLFLVCTANGEVVTNHLFIND